MENIVEKTDWEDMIEFLQDTKRQVLEFKQYIEENFASYVNPDQTIFYAAAQIMEALRDDPTKDNTPFEHPAFTRGQHDGVRGACERIEQVLSGVDDGSGVLGNERLEKLRREVFAIKTRAGA